MLGQFHMVKASLGYSIESVFILICVRLSILPRVTFIEVAGLSGQGFLDAAEDQQVDELFEGECLILLVWKLDVLVEDETLALPGQCAQFVHAKPFWSSYCADRFYACLAASAIGSVCYRSWSS